MGFPQSCPCSELLGDFTLLVRQVESFHQVKTALHTMPSKTVLALTHLT